MSQRPKAVGGTNLKRLPAQPKPIDISEQKPFENDLLEREKPIETLTNVLSNVDSPCILSIDAPWGAGKTTFLGMWEKYLRSRGFIVIEFNAWETDFSNDPFLALSSEITTQLDTMSLNNTAKGVLSALKRLANDTAARLPRFLSTSTAIGASAIGEPEIAQLAPLAGELVGSAAEGVLASHQRSQNSIKEFSEKLAELAETLSKNNAGQPIVIMIDELDRCRPTYAIELLENAKHIFSVANVVFVLATNRRELAQSVKAIYGQGFGADEYLERFFDISFNLPHQDRKEFITHTIGSATIHHHFKEQYIYGAFESLLNESDLNLRSIAKTIHHLSLVAAALGNSNSLQIDVASMVMLFRAVNIDSYQRFTEGRLDDSQITQSFLAGANMDSFSDLTIQAIFESVLWSANQKIKRNKETSTHLVEQVLMNKDGVDEMGIPGNLLREYSEVVLGRGSFQYNRIDMEGLLRSIELLSG